MTVYYSQRTALGNLGISYTSQEEADAQAASMDTANCVNCTGCWNCTNCRYCTDCTDCKYCTNCTSCTDCRYCTICRYCTDCRYCTSCRNCRYCRNCINTFGSLCWDASYEAYALLSLNGLRWPVSTDGKSIQIGCQFHSVEAWDAFTDRQIKCMDEDALKFWQENKSLILNLADIRRKQG